MFLKAAVLQTPRASSIPLPRSILRMVSSWRSRPCRHTHQLRECFCRSSAGKIGTGLIAESVSRLGQYAHELVNGYGIEASRFWFSPSLRYRLTGLGEEGQKHACGSRS